jgi:hypothetical protein
MTYPALLSGVKLTGVFKRAKPMFIITYPSLLKEAKLTGCLRGRNPSFIINPLPL